VLSTNINIRCKKKLLNLKNHGQKSKVMPLRTKQGIDAVPINNSSNKEFKIVKRYAD
jgi:hypothetical protein